MIKEKRIDSIDFLRGLSILAVILLHIKINMPFDKSDIGQFFPSFISKILFGSGYYGVIVFFVISGFLITTSSIKRWGSIKYIRYDQFYLIRFARIMPCLMGLLLILSILDIMGVKGFVIDKQQTSLAHAVFSALTFHINWLEAKAGYLPSSWDVLWSLSVEEAFYLFFPLICRWVKTETNFIFLMLGFVIIGPFARTIFANNDIWLDHSYLSCMDGIALGCIAALLTRKIKFSLNSSRILMFSGILLTLLIFIFRKQVYHLGLTTVGLNVTFLEIGISLMLIPLYWRAQNPFFFKKSSTSIIQWLGRNSYEIYLTHTFFILVLTEIFYGMRLSFNLLPLWYLLIIIISGIGGQLVSSYYSEPINKLIRKKFLNYFNPTTDKIRGESLSL